MRGRLIGGVLLAGLVMTAAGQISAQQRQSSPQQPSIMDDEDQQPSPPQSAKPPRRSRPPASAPALQPDPGLDADDQLAPSQMTQPMPAAVPEPSGGAGRKSKPAPRHAAVGGEPEAAVRAARPPRGAAHVVACSGAFAKTSSNVNLAMAFNGKNVTFVEVDGGAAGKVMASVLFPGDPKQRLEVWWQNPANRSGTYLIVINGQSTWTGPGGVRLGLTLPALEKLNRKSFKLKGFDNNVATASDWNGGVLAAAFPGGCKVGVSLRADPQAPAEGLRALAPDREFSSDDPAMRAVKPTVGEILIGY